MSWEEFAFLADQVDYNPFGGGESLAADLVIVGFGGWWMDRAVVNGRAGWRFQQMPRRLGRGRPFIRLVGSRNAASTTMAGLNRLFREVDPLAGSDEDEPLHPGYALRGTEQDGH